MKRVSKRSLIVIAAVLPAGAFAVLLGGEAAPAAQKRSREVVAPRTVVAAPIRSAPAPALLREKPREQPKPADPSKQREVLARFKSADPVTARALFEQLLAEPGPLTSREFVAGLLDAASDRSTSPTVRELALDLAGRAPGADATTVARIRELALAPDLDDETRTWAIVALRQLGLDRPELEAPLRAALLDAAAQAPTREARADALEGLTTTTATSAEVARTGEFLRDTDALVRTGAARALASSPAASRQDVAATLERALANESDSETAKELVMAALRVGRADAGALLARMESAPLVRSTPALARQIADYRDSLAGGETNVATILHAHDELEETRARDGR